MAFIPALLDVLTLIAGVGMGLMMLFRPRAFLNVYTVGRYPHRDGPLPEQHNADSSFGTTWLCRFLRFGGVVLIGGSIYFFGLPFVGV